MCCLHPAFVSEPLFLSVQSPALILCLLWIVFILCGISGTQTGQLLGVVPVVELGGGAAVLANLPCATSPMLDPSKCWGIWRLGIRVERYVRLGTAYGDSWVWFGQVCSGGCALSSGAGFICSSTTFSLGPRLRLAGLEYKCPQENLWAWHIASKLVS